MSRPDIYLSDDRYLAALGRQRTRIEAGLPFFAIDDTTPGDKSTEASWGLCTSDWPTKDRTRAGIKYRAKRHKCPFDADPEPNPSGCFWRCRIFQGAVSPTQEQALDLYDITIARATGDRS
jgi:hypothetical protein